MQCRKLVPNAGSQNTFLKVLTRFVLKTWHPTKDMFLKGLTSCFRKVTPSVGSCDTFISFNSMQFKKCGTQCRVSRLDLIYFKDNKNQDIHL